MNRRRRSERGFALLETLLALLLFALGLLGACAALATSLRASHQALLAGRAVDLAADHVEDLHALGATAEAAPLVEASRQRVHDNLPPAARDTALELMRIGGVFRSQEPW